MLKLRRWQWIVLAIPPLGLISGLAVLAGLQLQDWGLSWVWALVAIAIGLWRWLFSQWSKPNQLALEENLTTVRSQLQDTLSATAQKVPPERIEVVLRQTLETARDDQPLWEDWPTFTQRCQTLIRDIAHLYHPEEKYPLLNIYVPQAYGLIRGTVDDLDRYMRVAAPRIKSGDCRAGLPNLRNLSSFRNAAQAVVDGGGSEPLVVESHRRGGAGGRSTFGPSGQSAVVDEL